MESATLALIITVAIAVQVVVFALPGILQRKSRVGVEGDDEPVSAPVSAPWEGFISFEVSRREVEDEAGEVCSFYLSPLDGAPLPPYLPGQYLTFSLTPGGESERPLVRCYSLSDRPRPEHYRITVKRVPAAVPELPPGRSSNYLHDHVPTGARLQVRAPAGHFLLREEPLPVVLIGGGIGITPMLSMLNTLLAGGSGREVWLYYGVRNGREQIMKGHLRALDEAHPNLHLHLCYSDPQPADREGIDFQHRGRVDLPLLRATLRLMRYQFYVCGPRAMMESLVPGLEEWGVAPGDIHYEAFGPATLKRIPAAAAAQAPGPGPEPPRQITFSRSGRSAAWDPAAGSLLAFAEAQEIAIDSGCRSGSCGCCQTRLEAGEVSYVQEPDADIQPGHCLPCIATPRGDLVLGL
ncbi:MAG: 2Fe-2S iron-sulfur cluster-binding protein [Candidatus Sedimenticola endophacoides]